VGLTIHYKLQAEARTAKEARQLVEQLRKRALDLPFAEVGAVVELKGAAADLEKCDRHNPLRWLLIQAGQYVERDDVHYRVTPKHVIAFSTDPGDDCEDANFGLCLYPGTIFVPDQRTGLSCRLRTELKGWCWSSFCKTQYATLHGSEHFIRCHLLVIRMLDLAKELGILASVRDEGDFWERRDVEALAREVGQWNEGMAALVGKLKDMFGGSFDAPITKFPNFEHLEARGAKKKE
jgi:hypothetical protein